MSHVSIYIKDKNFNIYTAGDRMAYSKDPKMLVPVYIRDILGDYTDVSSHSMRKVYGHSPKSIMISPPRRWPRMATAT